MQEYTIRTIQQQLVPVAHHTSRSTDNEISQFLRISASSTQNITPGMLGKLQYRESEHGWTINLGQELARYPILSSVPTEDIPGLESARRELVEKANSILANQNIRYIIPDIIPGSDQPVRILQDLIEQINYRFTQAHLGCFIIAMACYKLLLALEPATDVRELKGSAHHILELLDQCCPELEIDSAALFKHAVQVVPNIKSIRQFMYSY